jgi:hypothetical protein
MTLADKNRQVSAWRHGPRNGTFYWRQIPKMPKIHQPVRNSALKSAKARINSVQGD